ncbi:hypothetical protein TRICHSKD4_3362 [Roseibium sp. TrichSKD4]|uniref:hypothetical protein n=1 Tax=Roseibium sp. TrichSKD4 TaxID=744980 RepID=UPI0001E56F56|nr:hypothetical protein [Roseibium sp. TrichSKD4]EFO31345.1 hypothetical protein TRICHSKD4_3362 [Roseibium sp. TrichSKD4]
MSDQDETKQNLKTLQGVISEGVSEIRDGDKTVKYRPLPELTEIAQELQRKAKKKGRRRRLFNPQVDRGIF